MRIDAHQHFWHYDPRGYGWITEGMGIIQRSFLPEDLQKEMARVGIVGSICVQARQTIEETKWLLELSDQYEWIKGVVGWVPLSSRDAQRELEAFSSFQNFKGVRHILQDEADDYFMLREDFNQGIRGLKGLDLVYEILIYERHLPQTLQFVDRHPNQIFVLDHMAKPRMKEQRNSSWHENIRRLAERENVYCKISGLATEADWKDWSEEDLRPYWETVLEAFGPRRLLFGSDWPVCLLATSYQRWYQAVSTFAAGLSAGEQSRLFGETAAAVYRL